jgi:uracil-DNA glycosylase
MPTDFCPGYGNEPFRTLVRECPGEEVFPRKSFRVEWGPVFHRGRLDGSARVLVIGQDPAQHEVMLRRILVGRAGQRLQGFLAKLGLTRSYVMVNAFAHSVYGQHSGDQFRDDSAIAAYRQRWIEAIFDSSEIEGVIALGAIAERAWKRWKRTPRGKSVSPVFVRLIHPTAPEAIAQKKAKKSAALLATVTAEMLAKWNTALTKLDAALGVRDDPRPLVPYGANWAPGDEVDIPDFDVPGGTPAWMRTHDDWAVRTGATATEKRRTIVVTVPA